MKKLLYLMIVVSSFETMADQYLSKHYGFTLKPPVSASSLSQTHQIAMFLLPPTDGFAPNVNIQLQVWGKSLKAYKSLSENQLKGMSFQVIRSSLKADQVIFEYTGMSQGKKLHWYSKAVAKGKNIYLITATALHSQWASTGKDLIESVDSLKLTSD